MSSDERVVLFVGPPGIGKTKALNDVLQQHYNIRSVDGSSPEFVQYSVKEKFISLGLHYPLDSKDNKKLQIFIVDEFHMMKTSQKKDILLLAHQYKCKLILIANRYHFGDIAEINRYLFNGESKESEYLLECGGNLDEILSLVQKSVTSNQQEALHFFKCFLKVSRLYLGEEILSFRFANKVLEIFRGFGRADFYNNLAIALHEKFPHIPLNFLNTFTSYFRVYFKRGADHAKKLFENPQPKPLIELLVAAAFLHVDSDASILSYPEFISNPKFLPASFKYHPGRKLYNYFVLIVCAKIGKPCAVQLKELESIFYSSLIVDVPFRFPQIYLESTLKDKIHAYTLTIRVPNPFDLESMVTLRQIGYAINTQNLKAWHDKFLTNVPLLKKLLAIWPEASNHMHPQNKRNLLQLADVELAKIFKDNAESRVATKADSEYFIASWVYHCNVPEMFKDLKDVELHELLLWAAKFALNLNKVVIDVNDFERELRETLLNVTNHYMSKLPDPAAVKYIQQLWNGTFAQWARIDMQDGSRPFLGWRVAFYLAASDNYNRNWHKVIVNLHFLYKGTAPYGTLAKLWQDNEQLLEDVVKIEDTVVRTKFFDSIMNSLSELSPVQLYSILTKAIPFGLISNDYATINYVEHFMKCSHQFIEEFLLVEQENVGALPSANAKLFWAVIEYYYNRANNFIAKLEYRHYEEKGFFPGITLAKIQSINSEWPSEA